MSQLGELEFRNSLHLTVFRGDLPASDAAVKKRLFLEDVANGIFIIMPVPAAELFARSIALADRHSARRLDLIHVAAALLLKAETFLSFDERQRKVAKLEKLKVKP